MTAEEFFIKLGFMPSHHKLGHDTKTAMVEFAKLKVQEALETAADKVRVKTIIPIENGCRMFTDAYEDVDKDSILNAYDLNSIV